MAAGPACSRCCDCFPFCGRRKKWLRSFTSAVPSSRWLRRFTASFRSASDAGPQAAAGQAHRVPLIALAVGRSGDKGNLANIGIIARKPEYLPWLRAALTEEVVRDCFAHNGVSKVDRFDLPGMNALNFVLHDALGGGGVASLRVDAQGKAFAQMLMDYPVGTGCHRDAPDGRARNPQRRGAGMTQFGKTDDELATMPLTFRDGLFAGQVVLVSGAGRGIGKAIAFLFARLGAKLVLCGRDQARLDAVAGALSGLGAEVLAQPTSIRDPDAVGKLFDATAGRFRFLDILVNNAGGQFPQAAIDFSSKGFTAVVETNLNGTWYMMQQAARRWRDAGRGGRIVNIVAVTTRGMPGVAHTAAARAGVVRCRRRSRSNGRRSAFRSTA